MKKFLLLAMLAIFSFAEQPQYEDPLTGTRLIFHPRTGQVVGMEASAETELTFGDRRDIRIATKKAVLRAKASLAKFMKERIKTKEVSEEIVKTMIKQTGQSEEATRKTVQVDTEKIENSADALLKGVVVKNVKVNKGEKYVTVTIMTTLKTQKIADQMNNRMNRNLDNRGGYGGNRGGYGSQGGGSQEYRLHNESMYY